MIACLQEVAKLQAQKEQLQLRQSLLNETHTDLDERVGQLKQDIEAASIATTSLEDSLDVLVKQVHHTFETHICSQNKHWYLLIFQQCADYLTLRPRLCFKCSSHQWA